MSTKTRENGANPRRYCYRGALLATGWVLSVTGCGVDLNQLLIEAANVGATTALDILLTDVVVNAADAVEDIEDAPIDSADGDSDTEDDDSAGGEVSIDIEGDIAAGQDLFTSSGCAACHCADATGGCALSAPSLIDVDVDTLNAKLRVNGPHFGIDTGLGDQQIADLQAFFASF